MPRKGKKLSLKQLRFCAEYAKNGNATQAAIAAGYPEKSAGAVGYENLTKPLISAKIEALRKAIEDEATSTISERRRTLTEIHRARMHHFGTAGADGFIPDIGPENLNSAGLGEVTTRVEIDAASDGEGKSKNGGKAAYITKIKLRDPIAAIQELNKMDGIYRDKPTEDLTNTLGRLIDTMSEQAFGPPHLQGK